MQQFIDWGTSTSIVQSSSNQENVRTNEFVYELTDL